MRTPRSCLILGSGMGGLALGALLARAGVAVTILEAHPEAIGGWAHTVHVKGYQFSAGPRYLWNFGPGQIGRHFLDKCCLTDRVPMVELDRQGFDHIYVGNDEPLFVPNGWSEYEVLLKGRFPTEAEGIRQFFSLCRKAFPAIEIIDEHGLQMESWKTTVWECFWRRPRSTAWVLHRRHLTLHQAFEMCRLSQSVRAVLSAHNPIFLMPSQSLSFLAYVAGTMFYQRGCYFPQEDMEGFTAALVNTIRNHKGTVLPNQCVVSAKAGVGGIEEVTTQTGERFAADVVVVNFDPKTFLALVNQTGTPSRFRYPDYRYSRSVLSLFLGITDKRILERHFGRWNIWFASKADPGPNAYDSGPLEEPELLYLNSPTLVKGLNNDSPPGHATVTAFVPASYRTWNQVPSAHLEEVKNKHIAMLINKIDQRFAPGLTRATDVVVFRTPKDKEQTLRAPLGNIYGRCFGPRDVWTKLPSKGILPNLYFVGQYVSFPGIASVIQGACIIYKELTGDRV